MNKTRILKKVLSLAMILMMVVSTMVIMPLTTSALDGAGTETNPYLVGSLADFEDLIAVQSSFYNQKCYVKIIADFNMDKSVGLGNYYPATSNDGAVMWQIDGQGHTISNTYKPLIYGACGGVVIQNLNVAMQQTNTDGYAAGIIGAASGANGTTLIENCTVSGVLNYPRTNTDRYAGCIVGAVIDASVVTIRNCTNNATITSGYTHDLGGIVGRASSSGTLTIENCVNNGTVTAVSVAGGFVGFNTATAVTILNSINNGKIEGDMAAGFIAKQEVASEITNCINNGDVDGTTCAGGFVGRHTKTIVFDTCVNNGTITAPFYAAGFVAMEPWGGIATTLNDCYDNGTMVRTLYYGATNAVVEVDNTGKTLEEVYDGIVKANVITADNTAPKWTGTVWSAETHADDPLVLEKSISDPEAEDVAVNSPTNRYIIDSAEKLAYFATATTDYYLKLTKNIDLNNVEWTPLATSIKVDSATTYFTVDIDGDNYSILNLQTTGSSVGFLKPVSGGSTTVSNLHFVGAYVKPASGVADVGLITSYAAYGGQLVLDNITIDATSWIGVTRTSSGNVGAFVGETWSGTTVLRISNCLVEGRITSPTYSSGTPRVGGLIGYSQNEGVDRLDVQNCILAGGILALPECTYKASLVGYITHSRQMKNVYVTAGLTNGFVVTMNNCYTGPAVNDEANAAAIAEIDRMGIDPTKVVFTNEATETTNRLKLTDDFGFMAITNIAKQDGVEISVYNPHVTYGIAVADTEAGVATGEFTPGGFYEEGRIYGAYTGVSVATMNQTFYYALGIQVGGQLILVPTVRDINCYAKAADMSDGYWGDAETGTLITFKNEFEKPLYGAMVDYHDAYVAYLEKHNLIVEGAN